MSLKRPTLTVRRRTRDEIHYRMAKIEREYIKKLRRAEKLARRKNTEH